MTSKTFVFVVTALAIALFGFAALTASFAPVDAAPAAAPTPVSVTRPAAMQSQLSTFPATAVTTDTIVGCMQSNNHSVADIQFVIDQTSVNTMTLKLQHTNDTPGSSATYINGANIVANNAADASDMVQLQLFGAWTCVYADVTNASTVNVNVSALLR